MKIAAFTLTALFSVAIFADSAWSQPTIRIWITNVTVISPENLDHVTKANVLIENGRILRIERHKPVKKITDATVIDGQGKYLIPGLIDSHVHLTLIPGMSDDQAASKPEIVNRYFQQLPRSYLYYGYTTVVDLGVAVDYQRMNEFRRAPLHPDVYTCGDALVPANGYPMAFWPAGTRFKFFPNFLYDPSKASSIPSDYKPEDHTPAAAVARIKSSGGICVKTFFEHGFRKNANLPVISRNVVAEIRKDAIQAGLPLILHANSFEAQRFGVDGGVDILAHGMWNWGPQ
jgi:imidazolonepropionase-like amidohydrolase